MALGLYVICLAALGIVLGHVESAHGKMARRRPGRRCSWRYRNRALELLLDAALVGLVLLGLRGAVSRREFLHFLPTCGSLPFVLVRETAGLWVTGSTAGLANFGAAEVTTILKGCGRRHRVGHSGVASLSLRGIFALGLRDAVIPSTLLIGSRVAVSRLDDYLLRQRGTVTS